MIDAIEHDLPELARRLGHDFYTRSRTPPQPDWPAAVREGYQAAAYEQLPRQAADRFQRKWLQLRLGAWRRGRAVAADVTPELLRELDVEHCPVTRRALTHGSGSASDWSVDRLNNDGAYAASNLAVMSVRANRAKAAHSFDAVLAMAAQPQPTKGLAPIEWQRLAALMLGPAHATRPHEAPVLPLCAPLPCRSVRLALQQVQHLFTLQAARPAGKNRLVRDLAPACGDERARRRLQALADAVHEGLKRLATDQLCWDVWLQPATLAALVDWQQALDAQGRARAARIAGLLAGARRETPALLRAWRLTSLGYLPGLRTGPPPLSGGVGIRA